MGSADLRRPLAFKNALQTNLCARLARLFTNPETEFLNQSNSKAASC